MHLVYGVRTAYAVQLPTLTVPGTITGRYLAILVVDDLELPLLPSFLPPPPSIIFYKTYKQEVVKQQHDKVVKI